MERVYNQNNRVRRFRQAVDHATGEVLAYVLNTHEDRAFLDLLALLRPNGCQHFYTDGWGTYERHIDEEQHTIGKRYTQKIERKHLNYRTRIKRLAKKFNLFFAHLSRCMRQ